MCGSRFSDAEYWEMHVVHARIIVTLRIFDSRRNRFEAQFRLVADRSALRVRERTKYAAVSAPFRLPANRNPLAVPVTVVDEAAERARCKRLLALGEERKRMAAKEKKMARV